MVLSDKSGSITLNFLYQRKFILPANRGFGKSGPGKSATDCYTTHTQVNIVENRYTTADTVSKKVVEHVFNL